VFSLGTNATLDLLNFGYYTDAKANVSLPITLKRGQCIIIAEDTRNRVIIMDYKGTFLLTLYSIENIGKILYIEGIAVKLP